jgi:ribosomal protein S18 acetylase RimI-like enzyme
MSISVIKDIQELYNLNHNIFTGNESYHIETIKHFVDKQSGYIIQKDNISIGYILYGILDGKFMILSFGILKEYRNQGYGKLLLKHFLSFHQSRSIYLHVRSFNFIAKNLYESLGFRDKKLEHNFYGNEDGVLMELII